MRTDSTPVGLPAGAPERLTTPAGSSVEVLPPDEWRPLRAASFALRLSFFPMLFVGLGVVKLAGLFIRLHESGDGPGWAMIVGAALTILTFLLILLTLALALFNQRVNRWGLRRLVGSRRGVRFRPSTGSIIASVEDAGTFGRMKSMPEDYAVIHLSRGGIDLEMSRVRVHLAPRDIRITLQPQDFETGVGLSAELQGWAWAVTLVPRGLLAGLYWDRSGRRITEEFLRRVGEEVDPSLVAHLLERDQR